MKTKRLIVKTNREKYSIFIGSGLVTNLKKIIKNQKINFIKCLIVFDKNVPKKKINIIKKNLKNKKIFIHHINANEKNKNQKTTNEILEVMLNNNFSREDTLISVGGGITGDIASHAQSF